MTVTRPTNLQKEFCESGTKSTVPVADQTGTISNGASFETGFPDITMLPRTSGGLPPLGQDVNGVLNAISQHTKFQNCGGRYRFDAALATVIGGYPAGFVLQDDAGTAEYVSVIDDNDGNFNTDPSLIGVTWLQYAGVVLPKVISGAAEAGFIRGGDMSKTGAHQITILPTSCLDSTGKVQLFYNTNSSLTIPTAANSRYHIFIVKLVADQSFDYRAYSTEAGVLSDAEVSHWQWLDYQETNGDSEVKESVTVAGVKWFSRFTENTINSLTTVPSGITTAISLSSFLPAGKYSEILFGGQGTANGTVAMSGVSGTIFTDLGVVNINNGAGDLFEWSYERHPSFISIPAGNLYWGKGTYGITGQVQFAIHAVKLRR